MKMGNFDSTDLAFSMLPYQKQYQQKNLRNLLAKDSPLNKAPRHEDHFPQGGRVSENRIILG